MKGVSDLMIRMLRIGLRKLQIRYLVLTAGSCSTGKAGTSETV